MSQITKEEVFIACKNIAKSYTMPTIKMVRVELGGRGSETTILKYLSDWKRKLLKLANNRNQDLILANNSQNIDLNKLQAELKRYQEYNESLSRELIANERKVLYLKEDNFNLNDKLKTNTQEITRLSEILSEIRNERSTMVDKILADKNSIINKLQEELSELHKTTTEKVESIGYKNDQNLIQEKISRINAQTKADSLQKELEIIKKVLEEEKLKNKPLVDLLQRQSKIIKELIPFEELQQYERQKTLEITKSSYE